MMKGGIMGTTFKSKKEKFDYQWSKQKSTICCVCNSLRYKGAFSWESGLTLKKLKEEVERRKGRPLTDQTIYDAISLINQFGQNTGVYIRSGHGFTIIDDNTSKTEYRYFIPRDNEIDNEKRDLDRRKERIENKESHLEYYEKISVAQEKSIELIRERSE